MIELIYISKANKRFSAAEVQDMLRIFRQKNHTTGVTGLLLYDGYGTFVQALEGDSTVLSSLYEKIKHDDRHTRVNLLGETEISKRSFPDWRMGFKNLDVSPAIDLEGYSDFLEHTDRTNYLAEKPNFAMDLLGHFKHNSKSNLDED
jgi:hypothetical protein